MSTAPSIVWFRQDLRLDDNPALTAAASSGSVLPLFIVPGKEENPWLPGPAGSWWQQQSMRRLDESLRRRGSQLLISDGPPNEALRRMAQATGAQQVHCNRRYEPAVAESDAQIQRGLTKLGVELKFHDSALLFDPASILNQQGQPYRVFTAFWTRCLRAEQPARPTEAPARITSPAVWPHAPENGAVNVHSSTEFIRDLEQNWRPGEPQALALLQQFMGEHLFRYLDLRDQPQINGTSRLSPYLHFGEISPRRIWQMMRECSVESQGRQTMHAAEGFLRQLIWREFAYYILHHFPQTPQEPSNPQFARFPWRHDKRALQAWQQGRTGYPMVDAGMRQLARTGWMHNRLRMIVASFLTKHLLLSWQSGAQWFWDHLVDADLANNTFGWQWAAGCGHDAAPYFRIFNPVLQGKKFDPQGAFVRRWVPELAKLPERWIHQPWEAPPAVLKDAGVGLGNNYPRPIVEHQHARRRALSVLTFLRESSRKSEGFQE